MDAAKGLLVLIAASALWIPSAALGQSGWSGGNSTTSAQAMYDRYGQPIVQRAQTAVSETSSALSDSFNAGVKAAEQSVSNWASQPANSSSTPLWSGTQSAAPAAPSWPSNQPAAATAVRSAPVSANGGWSSITSVAAPPLLVPNSPMATNSALGSSFTSVASNDTQPLHSVLKDPANSSTSRNSTNAGQSTDWSAGWSGDNNASNPASISRQTTGSTVGSAARDTGFAALQGAATTPAGDPRYGSNTQTGSSWSGSDSWSQTGQPSLGAANGAASVNRQNTASNPNTSFAGNNPQNGQISLPSIPQFTGQQAGQTANATNPGAGNFGSYNTPGTMPTSMSGMPGQATGGMNPYSQTQNAKGPVEAPQWMPMILSVMGLAASLAANLYLGVSYLDARQKYQSLVRKTAETFRRVKAVAA